MAIRKAGRGVAGWPQVKRFWVNRSWHTALLLMALAGTPAIISLGACESTAEQSVAQRVPTSALPRPSPPAGPSHLSLQAIRFAELPGWSEDRHQEAVQALRRSCLKVAAQPSNQSFGSDGRFGRVAHWQQICAAADRVDSADPVARRFFEQWFIPYRATNGTDSEGLFTGYYEPVLHGSWVRTGRYTVPLYRTPPEFGTGTRLPTRAQVQQGVLSRRGLELMWLDDPVDAFFLHIQGSGRVQMADGSFVRVGFAGKNGHPYFPIGAELKRRGEIRAEQMSMQSIRTWLIGHPGEAPRLMALNASYVFFRLIDGDGPIGAQGVPLLPGRSIAVDPTYVTYGIPVWLDTTDPLNGYGPLRRLVVAQDTGTAIKGPLRGDLFWGSGATASVGAGRMKQPGHWYLLLPKAAAAVG